MNSDNFANKIDNTYVINVEHTTDEGRYQLIIHNIFQELLDKIFNYNYQDFEKYITLEIGVTMDEIESLKSKGLYVKDINGNDI